MEHWSLYYSYTGHTKSQPATLAENETSHFTMNRIPNVPNTPGVYRSMCFAAMRQKARAYQPLSMSCLLMTRPRSYAGTHFGRIPHALVQQRCKLPSRRKEAEIFLIPKAPGVSSKKRFSR